MFTIITGIAMIAAIVIVFLARPIPGYGDEYYIPVKNPRLGITVPLKPVRFIAGFFGVIATVMFIFSIFVSN